MFSNLIRALGVATFLFTGASLAQNTACSTTSTKYFTIPGFAGSKGCIPSGYTAAQDQGKTNPSALASACENGCTSSFGGQRCVAYVAQLNKAADSGLYSGTCFYYGTPPSGPRQCANAPSDLIAGQRDSAVACFSASATAATAFCSSYLTIPIVTSYTTTVTPRTTTTSTSSFVTTESTTTTTTTTTSTTSTAVATSTSQSTVSTLTTTTSTTISTTRTTTIVTTISSNIAGAGSPAKRLKQRQNGPAPVPTPSCIPNYEPASIIRSACSCLSIQPSTLRTASTAASVTSRSTTLTGSTSRPVSTISSSITSIIVTTSTTITTSLTSATSTLVTVTTGTSTAVIARASCQIFPASNAYGSYDLTGHSSAATADDCCQICYNIPSCVLFLFISGTCNYGYQTDGICPNSKLDAYFQSDASRNVFLAGVGPCGIRRT